MREYPLPGFSNGSNSPALPTPAPTISEADATLLLHLHVLSMSPPRQTLSLLSHCCHGPFSEVPTREAGVTNSVWRKGNFRAEGVALPVALGEGWWQLPGGEGAGAGSGGHWGPSLFLSRSPSRCPYTVSLVFVSRSGSH